MQTVTLSDDSLSSSVLSAPAEEEEEGSEGNLPSFHERWRARGDAAPRYREDSKSLQALAMPRVNVDDNDLGLHNNQPLGSQGGFAVYAEFPLG